MANSSDFYATGHSTRALARLGVPGARAVVDLLDCANEKTAADAERAQSQGPELHRRLTSMLLGPTHAQAAAAEVLGLMDTPEARHLLTLWRSRKKDS